LAIAGIVLALVALNSVLLWRMLETDGHVRSAPGGAARETAQLAEQLPSPSPAPRPAAQSAGELRHTTTGSSGSDVASEAMHGVGERVRDTGHVQLPSGKAGSPVNPERGEPGAPSAPIPSGSIDPTSRPAIAPAPARGPVQVAPQAAGPRGGAPAAATSGADGSTSDSPSASPTPEPSPPVDGEKGATDHTPPVLQLLQFNPPVVEGGNVTTLTIQASDDLSGVKSFSGEIRSPNGLATLPFWSQVGGGGTTFTFQLSIPKGAESGIWYVSWISITDGADNALLLQAPAAARAPAGGTLTVTSKESDSTAPDVRQVWFDKATVDGGDKNTIRVDVRDDESGVASIMGACQSPSKSALLWFTCTLSADSGSWSGEVAIPKNAECGSWGIQQLAAKDKAGNTALLNADSPILAHAGFQVSSRADCDSTPPTLDSFDVSPTVVSSETATEVLVSAAVYDAGSGPAQMTGWFLGPVDGGGQPPKISFQCAATANDSRVPWTCRVVVPQRAARGTWKVGVIRLEDKAHNSREYTPADPVVSDRGFEVQ
jgi:hypothetical protein